MNPAERQTYTFEGVRWSAARRTSLWLAPEPNLSAMSDDYTVDIDPRDMFRAWASAVRSRGAFHKGMGEPWVTIYWSVQGDGVMETAPFQALDWPGDFLTHFTWPVDDRGERLNWLELPVQSGAKSAFVERATGWRPAPLQPVVSLELLESAFRGAT